MNSEQVQYLKSTPAQEITLKDWADLSEELVEKRLHNVWSGVLKSLNQSDKLEMREAYKRLSKMTFQEQVLIIRKVVTEVSYYYFFATIAYYEFPCDIY